MGKKETFAEYMKRMTPTHPPTDDEMAENARVHEVCVEYLRNSVPVARDCYEEEQDAASKHIGSPEVEFDGEKYWVDGLWCDNPLHACQHIHVTFGYTMRHAKKLVDQAKHDYEQRIADADFAAMERDGNHGHGAVIAMLFMFVIVFATATGGFWVASCTAAAIWSSIACAAFSAALFSSLEQKVRK